MSDLTVVDRAQIAGAFGASVGLVCVQVEELDFRPQDYESIQASGFADDVIDALVEIRDWAEEALAHLVPA